MQNQYRFQVQMAWELDHRILSKVSSKESLLTYLVPVFTTIVVPMERQIRTLMFMFRQHTEAALFASDLKFHISSSTTEDIQSTFKFMKPEPIGGTKPDEALSILNMKLQSMVAQFKEVLNSHITQSQATDMSAEMNICVALYFTSYFHLKNISCRKFLQTFGNSD